MIAAVGLPCVIFIRERDQLTRLVGIVSVLTRAIAIVSELLILIITWMKTAHAWRTGLPPGVRSRLKLSILLLRDGEFVFLLGEQKLTGPRYAVFCVSIFSEVRLPRPTDDISSALFALNIVTLVLDVFGSEPDVSIPSTSFINVNEA